VPGGTPTTTAPTPSPTATWPPRIALPTPPPEMARDDEAGAVAAATYFITELYPYAVANHDVARFKEVSHSDCQFCASTASTIASELDAGRVTHPGSAVVKASTAKPMSTLAYEIDLSIHQDADTLWTVNGDLISQSSPRNMELAVFVVWRVDGWNLRGVDLLSLNGTPQ
jgi:hypothetical protein